MSVDAVAFVGGIVIGCLFALILCTALAVQNKGQGRAAPARDAGTRRRLEEYRFKLNQVNTENRVLKRRIQELEYEVEPLRTPGQVFRGDPLDVSFKVKSVR